MEENETLVPYVVYESAQARMERTIHKLWVLAILLIVLLVATNAGWIWYELQFIDEVTEAVTTTTDNGGNAYGTIISGENSEVHYGESGGNPQENPNP